MNVRTLSDGPTARQKILVVSIWIFSSLFGILTCFPGKFVTETADPIAEQLQSTIKPFINPFQDKDYAKGTVKLSYAKVLVFCLLKSVNLQYNTLVHWADGTNDSSTKCLMFQVYSFS